MANYKFYPFTHWLGCCSSKIKMRSNQGPCNDRGHKNSTYYVQNIECCHAHDKRMSLG